MSTSATTYNVIIKRFEDFANAHPLINRFTYGTIQEGDIGKSCTYPWMHVAPSSTNYDDGQRGMSFDILFADLVRDKDDKPENEKEIISDCSQLFEDLLATIENNTLFGDNALLQKPITITPFLNSFTNNLTGVEGTITIELDYTFDFCSVPVDFNFNIPTSGGQGGGVLTFDDSLNLSGTSVTLDNDVDTPGNDYYYGTDATGTKGWYSLPGGGGGGGNILKGTASGTDTYTTTISGVTSYTDGDAYLIRFLTGNTTGCSLNINGLGARTLYRNNDGALIGGDIVDGAEMFCIYNSTLNGFQAIGTAPNTLLAYVTNVNGSTISKGQAVYAFGGQGDRLTVKLADNTSDATSAQTVGIVLSTSIANNQKGLIIVNGQLDGLSIFPTSTWADGDAVYLGSTPGSLTKVKPFAPNHLVYLGFVTTASNGNAGRMYVRVQNGYEMQELHNVSAQSPSNNDLLKYNTSTSLWESKAVNQLYSFNLSNAISASTTTWVGPGATGSSTENSAVTIMPHACTLSNMYVMHFFTTQPASGAQVITVRKNAADTAMVITIAAGAVANTVTPYSFTLSSVSFAAGDRLSIRRQNFATASGGLINGVSFSLSV